MEYGGDIISCAKEEKTKTSGIFAETHFQRNLLLPVNIFLLFPLYLAAYHVQYS